ncbi:MAG: glycerol-3-phosphate acyltransferase [Candidatus Hepatoplasma vulgare]|nr:MAG: glycerol-3-phosphate acyltransferase [Candidatus Hepatoplasma sp.]
MDSVLSSWQSVVGTLIFIIIGYLIGSFNMGQILSRQKNYDLGKRGSKNYGATNAGRIFGRTGFILVFSFDFLKGIFAALLFTFLAEFIGTQYGVRIFTDASICIALLFVLIGHCWPVYFKFKGGKGVATAFGIFTVLNFFFSALGGLFFLLAFYLTNKKVFIASILSTFFVACLLVMQIYIDTFDAITFDWTENWDLIFLGFSISALVTLRHYKNIKSFLNHENKNEIIEITELKKIKNHKNKNEKIEIIEPKKSKVYKNKYKKAKIIKSKKRK